MVTNNLTDLITLKEMYELTGYDKKQILKWITVGVLLPKEKEAVSLGGRSGLKSFYPRENIYRLGVLQWYENYFEKSPGKSLGIDGLKHLMFLFGFKSKEIYSNEKEVIKKNVSRLLSEIKSTGNIDLIVPEIYDNFLTFDGSSIEVFAPVLRKKTKLVKTLVAAFVRKFTNKIIFKLDWVDLILNAAKFNEKGFTRIQEGLLAMFFILPFQVGNPTLIQKYEDFLRVEDIQEYKILDKTLNNIYSFLVKIIPSKGFKSFIEMFIRPENAVLLPLIFIGLRESEGVIDYYDFHLDEKDFTEEELNIIPEQKSSPVDNRTYNLNLHSDKKESCN